MDRSNIIYLIGNNPYQDELKVWHDQTEERKVYCEVTSITQTEWFEGGRNGLNPSLRFRIFAPDYRGEELVRFNDKIYGVYRTYVDRNEIIDLYVEEKEGVKNG